MNTSRLNTTSMFTHMHLQRSFGSKRSDATRVRTNQSIHFSVNHQEMIHHLLVIPAIDSAVGTRALPSIVFQMRQQMKSVIVCRDVKDAATYAARFGGIALLLLLLKVGFYFDRRRRRIIFMALNYIRVFIIIVDVVLIHFLGDIRISFITPRTSTPPSATAA